MTRSSLTEETPSTPGWVDRRIRELLAPYGDAAVAAGNAYADCLAGVRGGVDVDGGHDRCRRGLMKALDDVPDRNALDQRLQALEAEISADT